jgi:hypothetical protein
MPEPDNPPQINPFHGRQKQKNLCIAPRKEEVQVGAAGASQEKEKPKRKAEQLPKSNHPNKAQKAVHISQPS